MEPLQRTKKSRAQITSDGSIHAWASLQDNYHEMEVEAEFSFPQLEVIDVHAIMKRYPHSECLRGLNNLPRAIGVRVEKGLTQKMEALIGGWGGCVHITNLFMECAHVAVGARYTRMREVMTTLAPDLSETDMIRVALDTGADIINSCETYANYSPRITQARNSPSSESYLKVKEIIESFAATKVQP